MVAPRQLLAFYITVGNEANAGLALWSPELLARLNLTSN